MAQHQSNDAAPNAQRREIIVTEASDCGSLHEFVHALAAILARLDAEQQNRVQSDSSQDVTDERKETR
jgi:hypothetical protein